MPSLPDTSQTARHLVDIFRSHFATLDPANREAGIGERGAADRRPQILLVGDEPMLQFSRRRILEAAGYTVMSAKGDVTVEQLFLRGIQVVLLCHTVREEAATRIANTFARLTPQVAVLRIVSLDDPGLDRGMPGWVSARPTDLLGAVAARLPHP